MDLPDLWADLAQYVSLGSLKKDDPVRFFIRRPSSDEARKEAIMRVARALAHSIERRIDEKLKLVPKPDASAEEFRAAGVVEGALFSREFVEGVVAHAQGSAAQDMPDVSFYLDSKGWELFRGSPSRILNAALVVNVLADPTERVRQLPSLLYLAQRTRAWFQEIFIPVGHLFGGGGIMRYVQLAVQHYIFLNLLLALGGPGIFADDAVRKMEGFPAGEDDVCPILHYLSDELPGYLDDIREQNILRDGGHWFRPQGDPLHNQFWNLRATQDERLETDEGARNSYLERCFEVIAAAHAVHRTSLETYAQTFPFYPLECGWSSGKDERADLLSSIITAFHSLDDTVLFTHEIADSLLLAHPNHTNEPSVTRKPSPTPDRSIVKHHSLYLELPPEVIIHINSFLQFADLLSLSVVCRRLRELCMGLLYAHVFSPALPPHRNLSRSNHWRLCSLLESRDDLRRYVRHVQLFYDHGVADGNVPPSVNPFWKGLPLFDPLSSLLPNVREATLSLQDPSVWSSESNRITYAALLILHQRAPSIQSVDLEVMSRTIHQPAEGLIPSKEVAGMIARSRECVPPSWGLRRFTLRLDLKQYDSESDIFFPIEPLLSSSASTLRFLSLSLNEGNFGDLAKLPDFTNVSKLVLWTHIDPAAIEIFLTHFPSVVDLDLGRNYRESWTGSTDLHPLDFAKHTPVTQHLTVSGYKVSQLSPSMQTVKADLSSGVDFTVSQHPSNEVQALCLLASNTYRLLDDISQIALSYPSLRSVEIRTHTASESCGIGVAKDNNAIMIVSHVLDMWPHLETLVMDIVDFRYRPRRRDFPDADAGVDDEQRQWALGMFKRHGTLNVIALAGVPPDIEENPYRFPKRVWRREGNDAVMVGREAIHWKFDS